MGFYSMTDVDLAGRRLVRNLGLIHLLRNDVLVTWPTYAGQSHVRGTLVEVRHSGGAKPGYAAVVIYGDDDKVTTITIGNLTSVLPWFDCHCGHSGGCGRKSAGSDGIPYWRCDNCKTPFIPSEHKSA